MKTYKVAAHCQNGRMSATERANRYKEYDITAENESVAIDRAGGLYKLEMNFAADTIEVIN